MVFASLFKPKKFFFPTNPHSTRSKSMPPALFAALMPVSSDIPLASKHENRAAPVSACQRGAGWADFITNTAARLIAFAFLVSGRGKKKAELFRMKSDIHCCMKWRPVVLGSCWFCVVVEGGNPCGGRGGPGVGRYNWNVCNVQMDSDLYIYKYIAVDL